MAQQISTKGNGGSSVIPVDVGRLSNGLKTMFHGMSEVFGSIGAGEEAVQMISGSRQVVDKATEAEGTAASLDPSSEKTADTDTPKEEPAAAEEDTEAQPKKEDKAEPANKNSSITLADIQKIAGDKILENRANGAKIQKIIASFGVSKLGDLPEDKYEAFMTQLGSL